MMNSQAAHKRVISQDSLPNDTEKGHIRAVVLENVVWKHIQEVISVVTRYEAYFRSEREQKLRLQSEETMRLCRKRLTQAEKRIGELDRLFIRSDEDNTDPIRSQRSCEGGLCRSTGSVQRQTQAENPYLL